MGLAKSHMDRAREAPKPVSPSASYTESATPTIFPGAPALWKQASLPQAPAFLPKILPSRLLCSSLPAYIGKIRSLTSRKWACFLPKPTELAPGWVPYPQNNTLLLLFEKSRGLKVLGNLLSPFLTHFLNSLTENECSCCCCNKS